MPYSTHRSGIGKCTRNQKLSIIVVATVCVLAFIFVSTMGPRPQESRRRYRLKFSSENLARKSHAATRVVAVSGRGYVELYNGASNPEICWRITFIGVNTYVTDMNLHGPLAGSGNDVINTGAFLSMGGHYDKDLDAYSSCNPATVEAVNAIFEDPSRFYVLALNPEELARSDLEGQWELP